MIHVEKAVDSARQALEEGRLDEAEQELRAVLEFDDFEPRALRLMGKLTSRRGEPQRAAEFYKQALKARDPEQRQRPKGPLPTPTLAELYATQGYPEAAGEVYRELLDQANGDPRSDGWRRRLAELEGAEAAPWEPAPAEEANAAAAEDPGPTGAGGDAVAPEPTADDSGTGEPEPVAGGTVDPVLAEQRLRAFLERLDGNPEIARLQGFLQRLDGGPS